MVDVIGDLLGTLIDASDTLAKWVHSSVVRAADCRSAGPWFNSGCALCSSFVAAYVAARSRERMMIAEAAP